MFIKCSPKYITNVRLFQWHGTKKKCAFILTLDASNMKTRIITSKFVNLSLDQLDFTN